MITKHNLAIKNEFIEWLKVSPSRFERNGKPRYNRHKQMITYSPVTICKYERFTRQFIEFISAREVKIEDLDVITYKEYLQFRGGHEQSYFLEALPCFLNFVENKTGKQSIFKKKNEQGDWLVKWPIPTSGIKEIPNLDPQIWNRIIEADCFSFEINGVRKQLAIRLMAQGLRIHEIANLQWKNFHPNFMEGDFNITHEDEMMIKDIQRKGGDYWNAMLEPPAWRALQRWYHIYRLENCGLSSETNHDDAYNLIADKFIFNIKGTKPQIATLWKWFNQVIEKYAPQFKGIITPHMMRHLWARKFLITSPHLFINGGYRLGGWRSPKTAVERYGKGEENMAITALRKEMKNLNMDGLVTG